MFHVKRPELRSGRFLVIRPVKRAASLQVLVRRGSQAHTNLRDAVPLSLYVGSFLISFFFRYRSFPMPRRQIGVALGTAHSWEHHPGLGASLRPVRQLRTAPLQLILAHRAQVLRECG